MLFALSVPDFRRSGKRNLRHKLTDIIVLLILARISKCVKRTDIRQLHGEDNMGKVICIDGKAGMAPASACFRPASAASHRTPPKESGDGDRKSAEIRNASGDVSDLRGALRLCKIRDSLPPPKFIQFAEYSDKPGKRPKLRYTFLLP